VSKDERKQQDKSNVLDVVLIVLLEIAWGESRRLGEYNAPDTFVKTFKYIIDHYC